MPNTLGHAQVIARCFNRHIAGEAYAVDWHDPQSMQPAFEHWGPDLVVQMGSEKPPSELGDDDAWSQLVIDAGVGMTLLLHLPPLRRSALQWRCE